MDASAQDRRADRIVAHARLRPADEESAPALRHAVEDALRTVDFGDCGRLIVVRRLRLGGLPQRPTPAQVERAISREWRALAPAALPAAHSRSAQADAVFWPSRFAARWQWLADWAEERPVDAWFWPEAIAVAAASPAATAAAVVAELLAESPTALIELLRAAADHRAVALTTRLGAASLTKLLAAVLGDRSPPATSRATTVADPSRPLASAVATRPDPVAALVRALLKLPAARRDAIESAADPGRRLLAALWLPRGQVETGAALGLALGSALARLDVERSASAQWPADFHHSTTGDRAGLAPGEATEPAGPAAALGATAGDPGDSGVAQRLQGRSPSPAPSGPAPPAPPEAPPLAPAVPLLRLQDAAALAETPSARGAPKSRRRAANDGLAWLRDARSSAQGGALFFVNALRRIGFEAWLAKQPLDAQAALVRELVDGWLDCCAIAADDPQRDWWATIAAETAAPGEQGLVALPPVWRQPIRIAGEASPVAVGVAVAARIWQAALRRRLRRSIGIGVAEMVSRPAWVSWSPTHLDVVIALDEVDLRLRRHGLDVDPGWVTWLGTIIAFHFVARDQLPGADPA